jgi:hypothetical protein
MNRLVPIVAILLAACESPLTQGVRAKAADDFGCNDEDVQVLPASGEQSVARGCGHKATYVCVPPKNPFAETYSCSQVPSSSSPASSAPPMSPSPAAPTAPASAMSPP